MGVAGVEGDPLEERKRILIGVVSWYQNNYFRNNVQSRELCNDLIQSIYEAKTEDELHTLEQVVDGWLESY